MSAMRVAIGALLALLTACGGGGDDCEIQIREAPAPVQGQEPVNVPSCRER